MFVYAETGDHPKRGMVEFEADLVTAKPKAVRIKYRGTVQWLPRSRVTIEDGRGARVVVTMPKWLARARGYV